MEKDIAIREVKNRTADTIARLVRIWERAVRTTHLFLSEREIAEIKRRVPQALRAVPHLFVAETGGLPAGFACVDGRRLEMLFVAAENRGAGLGKRLLQYAEENLGSAFMSTWAIRLTSARTRTNRAPLIRSCI